MTLRAEMAYAHVDLPPSLPEIHAANQFGFYAESTFRFYDDSLWAFERASFGVVARADYIDLNLDERAVTREAMGSETTRLTVGPWFRPAPGTTLRVVYRHDWLTDELQNPHRAGGIQFGIATYF